MNDNEKLENEYIDTAIDDNTEPNPQDLVPPREEEVFETQEDLEADNGLEPEDAPVAEDVPDSDETADEETSDADDVSEDGSHDGEQGEEDIEPDSDEEEFFFGDDLTKGQKLEDRMGFSVSSGSAPAHREHKRSNAVITMLRKARTYMRDKRNRKKVKRRTFALLLVLLIAFVVVNREAFTLSNLEITFGNLSAIAHGKDIDAIDFSYDTINKYAVYKDALVIATDSGLSLERASDTDTFIDKSFSDVRVDSDDRYLLAYDYLGSTFCVVSGVEKVNDKTLQGTILGARLSESGAYTVITKVTGYHSLITVYDRNHEEVYKYYLAKNWACDAHLSPNGKNMAVVYADIQSESFRGGVALLKLSSEEPAFTYEISGELPLSVEYKARNLIAVLHTGGIVLLRADGSVAGEYSFDGETPKFAELGCSNYNCVLLTNEDSDMGKLITINNSGVATGEYQLNSKVKRMIATRSNIFLYTGNDLMIFDSSARLRKTVKLESNIRDIIESPSGEIYSIGIGKAKRIKY